jgi:peptidoglycan/xylan/chitin deacetylase (PgdA/CDA1 family)
MIADIPFIPTKAMTTYDDYPRDLIGYGRNPPHAQWPGQARVALQFVLNYEEGAENNVLHGDPASETFLSEIIGAAAFPMRHMSMESLYEYGSRAGLWRLLRMFEERKLPLTIFGVAMKRWPPSASLATRSPATACAGSRTRTSTRRPSAPTCARRSRLFAT